MKQSVVHMIKIITQFEYFPAALFGQATLHTDGVLIEPQLHSPFPRVNQRANAKSGDNETAIALH